MIKPIDYEFLARVVLLPVKTKTLRFSMVQKLLNRNAVLATTPEGKLFVAIIWQAFVDLHDVAHSVEAFRFFHGSWFTELCDRCGLCPDFTREVVFNKGLPVVRDLKAAA